ncbi:hypothetical protein OBBRIDRAFT_822387 [Obba rivulosa]|uniref:Uncharacterized protein n=1 Tax=Obba rivulosa TaxID=1052685 RepID=A0A8E2DUX1_9APHY|nr:hypothetical protein OBBRIDRAFT_822387 [Obba rivulosa]
MSSQASSSTCPAFKHREHFSRSSGKGGWYCNICTSANRAKQESMNAASAIRHERYSKLHARRVDEVELRNWNMGTGWEAGWKDDWRNNGDSGWGYMATSTGWFVDPAAEKLKGFITFWQDGICAAERGEGIGNLGEFLDNLEAAIKAKAEEVEEELSKPKANAVATNPWTKNQSGWGANDDLGSWGVRANSQAWEDDGDGWGAGVRNWGDDEGDAWGDANDRPAAASPGDAWGMPERKTGGWGESGNTTTPWGTTPEHAGGGWGNTGGQDQASDDGSCPDREQFTFVERIARKNAADAAKKRRMHQFIKMPTEAKVQKIMEMVHYLHSLQRSA